ncbi:MAG: hypothetical protein ACLPSF_15230 [Methylocella sp.]
MAARIALIPAAPPAKSERRRTIKRYAVRAAHEVRSVTKRIAFLLFLKAPALIEPS